jgi:hypothetical protein
MIADFASVMVDPPRVRCLGVELLPFSLGHFLTLRQIGSTFIENEATPDDLSVTAFVCAHSWEENQRLLRSPLRSRITMLIWGWLTRKFNQREHARALFDYITEQLSLPEIKQQNGGSVRYLASAWETRVFAHLRFLGYSDSEALNMPLARAHLLWVQKLEADREMNFKTPHDYSREEKVRPLLEEMERQEAKG